jgi:hypothetical protein
VISCTTLEKLVSHATLQLSAAWQLIARIIKDLLRHTSRARDGSPRWTSGPTQSGYTIPRVAHRYHPEERLESKHPIRAIQCSPRHSRPSKLWCLASEGSVERWNHHRCRGSVVERSTPWPVLKRALVLPCITDDVCALEAHYHPPSSNIRYLYGWLATNVTMRFLRLMFCVNTTNAKANACKLNERCREASTLR